METLTLAYLIRCFLCRRSNVTVVSGLCPGECKSRMDVRALGESSSVIESLQTRLRSNKRLHNT